MEFKAPGVVDRQPVKEPLQTGIKAIDSMIPIGRGQRELIIGDRTTGKTALCDRHDHQPEGPGRHLHLRGDRAEGVERRARSRRSCASTARWTTRSSSPRRRPRRRRSSTWRRTRAARWASTSSTTAATRSSCTTTSPSTPTPTGRCRCWCAGRPGREAYPGDVFYLHSRLLERAAKLSDELGGGSLTALPVIETQADDVSAYIPTNVISITDGQIFLKSDLFYSGVRPAINAGISVSRVGGNAQRRAMRKVAGRLRLDLAAYRELEAFSQFASELDAATQRQLSRGQRLVASLNQPQYAPWPLEEQVTAIWAATNGYLDDVPVAQVPRFHEELRQSLRAEGSILKTIVETRRPLRRDASRRCKKAVDGFKEGFFVEEERGLAAAAGIARGRPAGHQAADPVRAERREDHEGDGARRGLAAAPCPGPDRGPAPVRRPHAGAHRRGRRGDARGPTTSRCSSGATCRRVAVIALTADRGLAGGFNANVVRRSLEVATRAPRATATTSSGSRRPRGHVDAALPRPGDRGLLHRHHRPARRTPTRRRSPSAWRSSTRELRVDQVVMVYNRFVSALAQKLEVVELLPVPESLLTARRPRRSRAPTWRSRTRATILSHLLPDVPRGDDLPGAARVDRLGARRAA